MSNIVINALNPLSSLAFAIWIICHIYVLLFYDINILIQYYSIAAIMNYHKFSGLKAHAFIRLAFCRLEVQQDFLWVKIKASEKLFTSGGCREESVFLPFLV